jgi:hypothetical protein
MIPPCGGRCKSPTARWHLRNRFSRFLQGIFKRRATGRTILSAQRKGERVGRSFLYPYAVD